MFFKYLYTESSIAHTPEGGVCPSSPCSHCLSFFSPTVSLSPETAPKPPPHQPAEVREETRRAEVFQVGLCCACKQSRGRKKGLSFSGASFTCIVIRTRHS